MLTYRPDKFAKIFAKNNGTAIWAFLNRQDVIEQMRAATYLKRPSVEVLAPILLQEFGGEITRKPIKQMIGHMVRQIMEAHGYRLDRANVRIARKGNFFYCGSRYVPVAAYG